MRRGALEGLADLEEEAAAVVGMDPRHPVGRADADLRRIQSDHLRPAVADVEAVLRHVPVPEGVVGSQRGERVALLALAQRLLGLFARGDLDDGSLEAEQRALAVAQRAGVL